MKASKSLRRPANWQDFESLCKKLWGEIWNCPEIKNTGERFFQICETTMYNWIKTGHLMPTHMGGKNYLTWKIFTAGWMKGRGRGGGDPLSMIGW